MRSARFGSVVLSVFPLTRRAREAHQARYGAQTHFFDIAALSRGGIAGTLQRLRRLRAGLVVVAGPESDLAGFGDLLRLMALLIPAWERRFEPEGRSQTRFGMGELPAVLLRLASGSLHGITALALNVRRAAGLLAGRHAVAVRPPGSNRCLYLKPTLQFGPPVGGSVAHATGVINALQRAGRETRFVGLSRHAQIAPSVPQSIVPPPATHSYPHELNWHVYHRLFAERALEEARAFRPAFIYQRYSINDCSGARVRQKLGIPLVLEFNGSEVWTQKHWGKPLRFQRAAERMERASLLCADLVVTVSEEIRQQALAEGVSQERVLFYPNCVDPAVFDPGRFDEATRRGLRERLGVPQDAELLTFVGSFGRWHGTDVLARTIRKLAESNRELLEQRRMHFLFVGDGALMPEVREILGPGAGAPWVTLAGYRPQEEGPEILAASDLFLSPHVPNPDGSPFFGSPTKLFEYMAMSKPIVASDLDQIGRVLRGWRPGGEPPGEAAAVLVEPGSVEGLRSGILEAVALDRSERTRLGDLARRYVLEAYTWDHHVAAILERLQASTAEARSAHSFAR